MMLLDYSLHFRLLMLIVALVLVAVTSLPLMRDLSNLLRRLLFPCSHFLHIIGVRLNRPSRSEDDRYLRGIIWMCICLAAALVAGTIVMVTTLSVPTGWIAECALVSCCFLASAVHHPEPYSYQRVKPAKDDASQLRFRIEQLVMRAAAALVTPSLIYLLLGIPGLLVWYMLMALVIHYPQMHDATYAFATPSHRLYHLVLLITMPLAQLLGSLIWWIALPAHRLDDGVTSTDDHPYFHHLAPLLEQASGHLHIYFGGTYLVNDDSESTPWIGCGTAQPKDSHLIKALYWYHMMLGGWLAIIVTLFASYSSMQ